MHIGILHLIQDRKLSHVTHKRVHCLGIIDQRCRTGEDGNFRLASIGLGNALCNFMKTLQNKFPLFGAIAAKRTIQFRFIRDNISGIPGNQLPDGQNACLRGLDLAGYNGFQREDQMGGNVDGINSGIRIGAMGAFPLNDDLKIIAGVHHCAFPPVNKHPQRHLSGSDMVGKGHVRLWVFQNPILNH